MKISIKLAIILNRTNKDFIFYNVNKDKEINSYCITNDYSNKKDYNHFKVISCIKPSIKNFNI